MAPTYSGGKTQGRDFLPGMVALVGAGPGDPDLLTIKALKRIQIADVVFYDRLVGDEVMALIKPDARLVPVGKSKGEHSVPQRKIEALLIEAALGGERVVRLKGGDPLIFGRGGEEVEALREAGIEVEIVPGISSALGAAASQQLPLTHRGIAQSVTFVTGHARLGEAPDLDWPALARGNQTVVVYMGVGTAPMIADRLIAAGRNGQVPVAVVENATRSDERVVVGDLANLPSLLEDHNIQGPALLVIGEAVSLSRSALAQLAVEAVS